MTGSRKIANPKLMKGFFYWYDIDDMPRLEVKRLKDEYEYKEIIHGNIIPNPNHGNEIVIFDMLETLDSFAASFRGFLYDDGKVMGKLTWNKGIEVREVDNMTGTYRKTSKQLAVQGECSESGGAVDHFYFELNK